MRPQRPSATACLIAASLGVCAGDPARAALVPALAAEMAPAAMRIYGFPASPFARFLHSHWFRKLVYGIERSTLPGIFVHYLLRKRFIEEKVHEGLKNGTAQLVVAGAGFD